MQNEDTGAAVRVSVALGTFNGARFLPQQLQSLREQSRMPDEVVACDDGSTDQTVQILEDFARSWPFPVTIYRNPQRLGPAGNFASAISRCTGSIIACCDQDDIWEPGKIAATLRAFDRDPEPAFVFSDAAVCDQDCKPLGYRLWSSVGFSGAWRRRFDAGRGFEVLLRQNVVTGATLSFRSEFRPLLLPILSGWMHDGWIALLLSAVSFGVAIDQPLIRYRQHASQSIGAERRSLYQQYLNAKQMDRSVFAEQAGQYEAALTRLQESSEVEVSLAVIRLLQAKIRHCRRRSAIRQREIGRILPSLEEWATGRYGRFSLGWKSFAQDLFL